MTGEEKEKVLDLLYDKFVYGLNDEEARELDHLGYDQRDAESIEKTIAALGLVDLDSATEMPASLTSKLLRDADDHFGADPANDVAAADSSWRRQRAFVVRLDGLGGRSGGVCRPHGLIVYSARWFAACGPTDANAVP